MVQFNVEQAWKLLAAYGVVHVLSEDLGVKSGKKQRELVHNPLVMALLLYAGAYAVTENHNLAVTVFLIYYGLKYIYSEGIEHSD
jgi:hypothetical protein